MAQERFTRQQTLELMEELAQLRVAHDVTLRTYFCNDGTPAYSVKVEDHLLQIPVMKAIIEVAERHGLAAWFDVKAELYPGDDGTWAPPEYEATIHHPEQQPPVRFLGSEMAPPVSR